MTKVFNFKKTSSPNPTTYDSKSNAKTVVRFKCKRIEQLLDEISKIKIHAGSPVCTPIYVTLDCSGSMKPHFNAIKKLFKYLSESLQKVSKNARDYILIIQIINNNKISLAYAGMIKDFNCEAFLRSLPEPYGMTPLSKNFKVAEEMIRLVYETLESQKWYYTVPIFFTVTDNKENSSSDDCSESISHYREDIRDGKKLFVEFITKKNSSGFNLGGYKVPIDSEESENLISKFVNVLKAASSVDAIIGDKTISSSRPIKQERAKFNQYYSNLLLLNFKTCFDTAFNKEGW